MTKRLLILASVLVLAFAACGGGDDDTGGDSASGGDNVLSDPDAGNGEKVFESTCVPCHGSGGGGIDGLGKPLHGSTFVAGLSDSELADFVEVGRDTSDPANTTGVAMPAKGGDRGLTEQDIVDVVAYIRTIQ
jgi:mono/diheme cytochrome c family protein